MLLTWPLLLACQPDPSPPAERPDLGQAEDTAAPSGDTDPGTADDTEAPPVDSAPPADTDGRDTEAPPEETAEPGDTAEITVEELGDHELDDSWIFSHEVIHELEITLPPESWDALFIDPYTYVEAGFSFNGEVLDPVGVRLRGKIGSFRDLNGKPKFKIDFNQFVEDQRFYGLETLSLNNEVVDCSYLKEPLGYALFEAMGVPASRTGFATLSVNGEPYGLFVIIEVPDDRFLIRSYEDPTGNLYDGKYVWYGGWDYTLLDFASGVDELFQLEEGTDVGNADITAVSEAVVAARYQQTYDEDMAAVVDWDNLHRVWAGEQWLGQNDGYALNTNNYRVYFDPSDGLMRMIPWDLDYSFLYDWEWGMSWGSPRGKLMAYCLQDASCAGAQRDAMAAAIDAAAALGLPARAQAMADLIAAEAIADPRRECSTASISAEQSEVISWLTSRSDEMRDYWGLE